MNILFVSISSLPHAGAHSITLDLIHEFQKLGHSVSILCSNERRNGKPTTLSEEAGCQVLRVRTGNLTKCHKIEKGIATVRLPHHYTKAFKKYFKNIRFDLVLYSTPPVTFAKIIRYIKKRDGAKSYLLLKDIFPQNAVDIGMLTKKGLKGFLYRYFRRKEKKLYALSDRIGCMSEANVRYLLAHNPEIDPATVEVCPNSIQVQDMSIDAEGRCELREKYGIPQDKTVFVYGGNLGKPQGIPFLIKALRTVREEQDAYFLVVGNGTEFKKLEAFSAEERQTNFKLMSRLPKEDYDRMVAACDVGLIFLDHRFTIPNFPSRLLSYMQAALPVLAATDPNTDVGEVIVNGGFGWWCESNDVEGFRTAVKQALAADRAAMKERETAYLNENYTAARGVQIILNAVEAK